MRLFREECTFGTRQFVAKAHWLHFSAQMHQTVFTFVYVSSYLHLYKEKTHNSE